MRLFSYQRCGSKKTTKGEALQGFTLIELLVVIAIIALLSTIILTALNAARAKANDGQRVSDLREVQKALEVYAADHNGLYPLQAAGWTSQCTNWLNGNDGTANAIIPGLAPTYIKQIPSDPQMNTATNKCCYLYISDGADYSFMDYDCPTSGSTKGQNKSLLDPSYYTSWAVYSYGRVAKGW